ncbi:MAG: hypothetical protein ACRD9Q_04960 [Nitrososphaeraceae archaeon]
MENVSESEFNRIFLKNFFREILRAKETYPIDLLDKMVGILADLFLREFGAGNLPSKILKEQKNIEDWLEDKIENFKP